MSNENSENRDEIRRRAREARELAKKGHALLCKEDEKSREEGVRCLKDALEIYDDPMAMFYLGKALYEGRGCERSYARAFSLFKRDVEKCADPNAAYYLFICYREGDGVNPSDREADKWLKRSVRMGNPLACYTLGQLKIFDSSDDETVAEGIELICLSAAQGLPESQKLAMRLADMGGVPLTPDEEEVIKDVFTERMKKALGIGLYEIATAIKAEDKDGRYEEEIVRWLEYSVKYDSPEGMYALSTVLGDGKSSFYDLDRSNELLRMSADLRYAPAETLMGVRLHEGIGMDRDDELSYEYLQRGSDDGDLGAKECINEYFG